MPPKPTTRRDRRPAPPVQAARWWRAAVTLEGPFAFLQTPGAWLWLLVGIGVAARGFLVLFTAGTYDVTMKIGHATGIHEHGLAGQYRASPVLNHPPPMALGFAALWSISERTGIPFRVLLRAPVAALDLGTAFLLGLLFRGSRYRWLVVGLYTIHPLAVIFSAYHGNTDSMIGFALVLAVWLASSRRAAGAGVALGASLWVKLPGLLGAPAIGWSFPRWRDRLLVAAVTVGVGALGYLPMLLTDPGIVVQRVLLYPGMIIETTAGLRVWGLQNFLRFHDPETESWSPLAVWLILAWFRHNTLVFAVPLLALAWLRRRACEPRELATTVVGCYAIMYALSNFWSFQYLAWSVPLWFAVGPLFLVAATVLAGGYIWGLYAFLCGDLLLRGEWDFVGHPLWPTWLVVLRDLAVLFFAVASVAFLGRALRDEWRHRALGEWVGRRRPSGALARRRR